MVEHLRVRNLRNLRRCELALGLGLNVVSGSNGAGKTTLLESIYLAARGRSFRGRRAGEITTEGERETEVEAVVAGPGSVTRRLCYHRVGTVGSRSLDGNPVLPTDRGAFRVRLIGENPQLLIDGDPSLRRRFLDWNLFHVEPTYGPVWSRFRRVLLQRNAWLRDRRGGRSVWDAEYLSAAAELERMRRGYVCRWRSKFDELARAFEFSQGASLVFYPGWTAGRDLAACLEEDFKTERKLGYTRLGPGRADFWVEKDGCRARSSRGQTKVLVCLLQLAARGLDAQGSSSAPTAWLLDDLVSDLDRASFLRLIRLFEDTADQCILTTTAPGTVADLEPTDQFHVEHGQVHPSPDPRQTVLR